MEPHGPEVAGLIAGRGSRTERQRERVAAKRSSSICRTASRPMSAGIRSKRIVSACCPGGDSACIVVCLTYTQLMEQQWVEPELLVLGIKVPVPLPRELPLCER